MIVLDMEWNQPLSPDTPLATRLCTRLPFEIIQIGAVKLETGETYKCTCRLQQYKVLSPRISKLTGITKAQVAAGESFQDAMARFHTFCGDDPMLFTWGFNDIPILRKNLEFYHLSTDIICRCYNLQIPFHQQFDPEGTVRGLSYAVDFFHIEADSDFHDGLNDAAYTAAVAKKLDLPRGIAEYPAYLSRFEGDGDQAYLDCLSYANYTCLGSYEDMMADPRIAACKCPVCGKSLAQTPWVTPDAGRMVSTAACPEDGEFFLRVGFKRNRDDTFRASKVVYPLDAVHRAQYKKAVEKSLRPRKPKVPPFRLFIDADGCPVVNQALRIAGKHRIESFLVCDTAHEFHRRGAETITVDKGRDSADFALADRVRSGDLVITQDYGLASMCLSRQTRILDQNGMEYTNENIEGLLTFRAEAARIRRGGGRLKGPQKRTEEQNQAFCAAFENLIQETLRA